MKAAIPICIN